MPKKKSPAKKNTPKSKASVPKKNSPVLLPVLTAVAGFIGGLIVDQAIHQADPTSKRFADTSSYRNFTPIHNERSPAQ